MMSFFFRGLTLRQFDNCRFNLCAKVCSKLAVELTINYRVHFAFVLPLFHILFKWF